MFRYPVISFSLTCLVCAGRTDIPNEDRLYKPYIGISPNSLVDFNKVSQLYNEGDSIELYSIFDTLNIINCELYKEIPPSISATYLSFEIQDDSLLFTVVMVDRDLNFVNLFLNAKLPKGNYQILDVPNKDYNGNGLSWKLIDDYFQYIKRGSDYGIYMVWPPWVLGR